MPPEQCSEHLEKASSRGLAFLQNKFDAARNSKLKIKLENRGTGKKDHDHIKTLYKAWSENKNKNHQSFKFIEREFNLWTPQTKDEHENQNPKNNAKVKLETSDKKHSDDDVIGPKTKNNS